MRWHALARHAWWAGCAARSCSKQRGGWRCARAAKTACAARPDPGGRAARSVDPAYACRARRARTGQQPRAFCAGALCHGRIPAEAVAWPRRCARRGRASGVVIRGRRVRGDKRRAPALLQAGAGPAARCRRGGGGCTSRRAAWRARPRCLGQRGRPHAAPQFSHNSNREWGPNSAAGVAWMSEPARGERGRSLQGRGRHERASFAPRGVRR